MKISKQSQSYRFVKQFAPSFYSWEDYTDCDFIFKFIQAIVACIFIYCIAGVIITICIGSIASYIYGAYLALFHWHQFVHSFGNSSDILWYNAASVTSFTLYSVIGSAALFIFSIKKMFYKAKQSDTVCSIKDIMRKRCKTMVEFTD